MQSTPENPQSNIERAQRTRLTRLYMAMATYAMIILASFLVSELSLRHMPFWAITVFISYSIITNAIFFVLIRSGLNLRFKDPSLTLPQLLLSSVWGWLPLYYFYDARVLCQLFYLPAFSFGMLQLNLKKYLIVVAIMMVTYGSAVWVDALTGRAGFSPKIELFQAAVFLLILLWFAFFGGFVSSLRYRLSNQYKELEAARTKIEKQAQTDELTQLYNRRHARLVMNEEKRKADSGQHVFSVAMIDIDHFKLINDRYGHEAGDDVLRQFSDLCTNLLRAGDAVAIPDSTLARYGGEEFIVVLPAANASQATACIERLRIAMRELSIPRLGDPVTFSAGVAEYQPSELIDPLLKRTDEALYRAKSEGRNRVCASLADMASN